MLNKIENPEVIVISFTKKTNMTQSAVKKKWNYWMPAKKNKVHSNVARTKSPVTFQNSLRATLTIGQLFALIPVLGLFSDNHLKVRFSWTSWKCFYSLILFLGQTFLTIMCIRKAVYSTASLNSTTPVVFYLSACITMAMFFQIAREWPELVHHVAKTEELDPNYDKKSIIKINATCSIILLLALLEHVLSLLSAFAVAKNCYPNISIYEGFARNFYPWVFDALPYSPALGVITQFLHFQSTFVWNFSDLFVICISYYLTSRLEQVNNKLFAAQGKYLPEIFWQTIREEYCRTVTLVRKVDSVISGIVFISFANNLFFICLQLFNTLEDGIKGTVQCDVRASSNSLLRGYETVLYFIFSLVYLITRSVAMSLIASQVNTASTQPAPVLYDVPSPVYCVEVQRFLDQVNCEKIALSGLQFFSVTRGLLLTVAGTIVTYELVMFQFNTSNSPPPTTFPSTSLSTMAPL